MTDFDDFSAPLFTSRDAVLYLKKSDAAVSGILKRETATGQLIRVRKGLYIIAKSKDGLLDHRSLSQNIYGPSYISMEFALAHHGLIPESVYTVTNVCQGKSKHFSTPLGEFSYQRVPQKLFYTLVERVEVLAGASFFMAKPLKALCDMLYISKKKWKSLAEACVDLRIDRDDLPNMDSSDVDELLENYHNSRIQKFLKSTHEELS